VTLGLPLSTLYAFLLVLARVGGVVAFLPVPGFKNAPDQIRIVIALALTFALFPVWPAVPNSDPGIAQLGAWAFCEAGFGLAAGLAIGFLTEGFQVAAQALGLQAGYGFATTIDPNSQADAGILQILATLMTGLLFFTLGLDREVFRILAASFERFPAGSWLLNAASADGILRLGAGMFSLGVRLALPLIGLLLIIDLALALLGRMQQQLQLLSLAFPVKMLAALALLSGLAPVMARLFERSATGALGAVWHTLGR